MTVKALRIELENQRLELTKKYHEVRSELSESEAKLLLEELKEKDEKLAIAIYALKDLED